MSEVHMDVTLQLAKIQDAVEKAQKEEAKLKRTLGRDHYMEELEQGRFADLLMFSSSVSSNTGYGSGSVTRSGSRATGRTGSGVAARSASTSSGYNSLSQISSEDLDDLFGKDSEVTIL